MAYRNKHAQRGQTLIQIMVALSISLVLLLGVGQVFISSKQTYRTNEALSRVQERGRFAENFLGYDLRMAGFLGCDANDNAERIDVVGNPGDSDVQNALTNPGQGIRGYSGGGSFPAALAGLGLGSGTGGPAQVRPNTETIVVKRAAPCPGGQLTGAANAGGPITVNNAAQCGFQDGQIAVITDCLSADVFQIGDVSVNSVTPANPLGNAYPASASMHLFEVNAFYIGTNDDGEPALYRRGIQGATMASRELVTGVEDLAAQYGLDSDNDRVVETYVNSGPTLPWEEVMSVRFTFPARSSADNVTESPQTYDLGNGPVTPGDNRLRRVFGSTAAMRNRLE